MPRLWLGAAAPHAPKFIAGYITLRLKGTLWLSMTLWLNTIMWLSSSVAQNDLGGLVCNFYRYSTLDPCLLFKLSWAVEPYD